MLGAREYLASRLGGFNPGKAPRYTVVGLKTRSGDGKYSAFVNSLCSWATVRRFDSQYRSCRCSVLLFHCIQLLNSGCSAIPVKCVTV
jgi:hypothetical protein